MRQVNWSGGLLVMIAIPAAVVVLAGLAFVGINLVTALAPEHRLPVDVTVQLVPDATGMRVTYVERARAGSLPATLEVVLWDRDAGSLDTGDRLTDAALIYSDARDGQGRPLPADQAARRRLRVPTDGHVMKVSFHVAMVGGRRVVYLPGSLVTTGMSIRLPTVVVRCLTPNSGSEPEAMDFRVCTLSGTSLDPIRNSYPIRLELT